MPNTDSIRSFIVFEERGPEVKASDLAEDSRLLNGVLSSVNLFRLVAFLKQEFSVVIDGR